MAVIIQQMVNPRLAGVAFTQGDRTVIDATGGTAEQIVAGLADTQQTQIPHGTTAPAPYQDVARLAETLQRDLGHDVDVEWAWDGVRVFLLQVRPVTAALHLRIATEPVFTYASLYFDDTLPPDLHLGDCADIYFSYTAKRAPLYRLADTYGIKTGRGWIIALNGAGLTERRSHPDWWATLDDQVVLDLGPTLRQHILPTARLSAFLHDALNLTGDPTTIHPVILREFTQGQAGIITSRALDGRTITEHAPQGLLAINRGLTEPERRFLPPPDDTATWEHIALPDGWHPDALYQLARFTHVLDQQIPRAHAEWVLTEGQPQFVDLSIANHPATTSTNVGTTVITAGTAQGPLLSLRDNEKLTELSVAPIISVNEPATAPW